MFSLLSLLDDIATTLDDVAVMTKVAIQKTSVLMSDDLAVNAGVVTGTPAKREIPIVKAIFWGSLLNKVYCIAGVLLLLAIYEPILNYILLLGGLFLCYEGAHKVIEKLSGHNDEKNTNLSEREKIKGAIRTDLVLSIEIILIAKQSISGTFLQELTSLTLVGLAASVLIYGLVAILVKIDDFGLYLIDKGHQKVGLSLVQLMPYMMKGLGIIGTVAMFLVGGGIVNHFFHLQFISIEIIQNLISGTISGMVVLGIIALGMRFKKS